MVGEAATTISPSSSRTSRSTPWVLGCWGPMLTVIVSVRISVMTALICNSGFRIRNSNLHPHSEFLIPNSSISLKALPELRFGHLQRLGIARRFVNLHGIVFPQRIPFPVVGHQQTSRIRMPVEHDAEQIPDLALEPVCRGPDIAHGRDVCVGGVQPHL